MPRLVLLHLFVVVDPCLLAAHDQLVVGADDVGSEQCCFHLSHLLRGVQGELVQWDRPVAVLFALVLALLVLVSAWRFLARCALCLGAGRAEAPGHQKQQKQKNLKLDHCPTLGPTDVGPGGGYEQAGCKEQYVETFHHTKHTQVDQVLWVEVPTQIGQQGNCQKQWALRACCTAHCREAKVEAQ